MTERAEIERLLNQTGRTLEGLPEFYSEEQQQAIYLEMAERKELWENRLLHQSDVIELLVGGLRDTLEKPLQKPMQKPLTLESVKIGKVLFIEFRDDCESDVEPVRIIEGFSYNLVGYEKCGWSARFNIDSFSYGRAWRCWSSRPTDEEREAAAWES